MIFIIIILFVLGAGITIAGFLLRGDDEGAYTGASNEYLEHMLEDRINQVEHRIGDVAEKSATTAQKQAKRELEKLSREKLSQVNEYSDQVMDQINKNHSEVMFLYGLLSDKQKELDETVESLNRAQKELQISQRISLQKSKEETSDKSFADTDYSGEDNDMSIEQHNNNSENNKENHNEKIIHGNGNYDKRAQIMMLAKEGKTELEIAKQLSMGVGEVKLVLDLSKGV